MSGGAGSITRLSRFPCLSQPFITYHRPPVKATLLAPLHAALLLLAPSLALAEGPPVTLPAPGEEPPPAVPTDGSALLLPPLAPPRFSHRPDGPDDRPPRADPWKGKAWDAYLWGRFRSNHTGAFPLDGPGARNDQKDWQETRLRLGGAWRPLDVLEVRAELDAFSGISGGDTTDLGSALGPDTLRYRVDRRFGALPESELIGGAQRLIELRQAYLAWRLPIGELRAGRMTFSAGLGMLANGGEGEPDFGDRRHGDLVDRVLVATRPLAGLRAGAFAESLQFFFAFDSVVRDENADSSRGDRAEQAVVGLQGGGKPFSIGAYHAFRWQKDREDPRHPELARSVVEAGSLDAWFDARLARFGRGHTLRIEAEGAWIHGRTTRPFPGGPIDGADLSAFGAVARLRYDDEPAGVHARLEAGFASGDSDGRDATASAFHFDPDYRVGLILFDQLLPRLTARAVDRLADPSTSSVPPAGLRFAINQGSISNAIFLYPVFRVRPVEGLDLRMAYLFAIAPSSVTDPYNTTLNGGYNTSFGGGPPGSRVLGHEIDMSVRYAIPIVSSLRVRVGAEGGFFFGGGALDGLASAPLGAVALGRLLGDVAW